MNSLNKDLELAHTQCSFGSIVDESTKEGYQYIYPFTNENINGYLNEFSLNNKSLLTTGSSGDQVINASIMGVNNATIIDINPYFKYYYYLKVAALLSLNKNQYLEFLSYKDYYAYNIHNDNVFNKSTFDKIKSTLLALDSDSYIFWNEIFNTYKPIQIRQELFSFDEENVLKLAKINKYLSSTIDYTNAKYYIKNTEVNFIKGNILNASIEKKYDNIWLSNILEHFKRKEIAECIEKYYSLLNNDGKLLLSYLYEELIDIDYIKQISPIHRNNYIQELLYNIEFEYKKLKSVYSILDNNTNKYTDKVLILKKIK